MSDCVPAVSEEHEVSCNECWETEACRENKTKELRGGGVSPAEALTGGVRAQEDGNDRNTPECHLKIDYSVKKTHRCHVEGDSNMNFV